MYSQEQWFDRTHDVFLDWLIAGGILALLGYLSLFFALLYMLWKGPKGVERHAHEWSITEKAVFTGMITAYFVHNLFVFDNLVSYIIFFLLLAYVSSRYNNTVVHDAHQSRPLIANQSTQALVAIVVAVLCVSGIYYMVYKPYMAGKYLILALQPNLVSASTQQKLTPEEDAQYRLEQVTKALSYNTFGNTEIRERLTDIAGNAYASIAAQAPQTLPDVLKNLDELVTTEYQKQLAQTPNDPRPFIFYGLYLQKLGAYEKALPFIEKAISLSPTKQSFYFQKGATLLAAGKTEEAVAALKQAYDIEPANLEAKVLYAIGLIYAEKYADAKAFINGDTTVGADGRVLQAYLAKNRFTDLVEIIKTKIAADPTNGQLHMSLAGVYLKMHQSSNAIKEIQEAMKLAPQFVQLGNYYIKEIRAGRDPSAAPAPTQEQINAANK
jgi:tetratricopeptide (TPR) repeat protein